MSLSGESPRLPLTIFPSLKYLEMLPELWKYPLEKGKLPAERGFSAACQGGVIGKGRSTADRDKVRPVAQ